MADATAQKVRVHCHACGARFKSSAKNAGKKGPCPKCGTVITIPALEAPADPTGEVDWSMLSDAVEAAGPSRAGAEYDLAIEEAPAPSKRQTYKAVTQADSLPPAALAAIKATSAASPKSPAKLLNYRAKGAVKAADAVPGAGRLVLGITLALVFGVVASLIWIVLRVFLFGGFATGYLAIGVGAAVGGGMYLGYGNRSVVAGALASVIAMGAIFVGIAIPAALLSLAGYGLEAAGQVTIVPFSEAVARAELPGVYADESLAERGLNMLTATELERLQAKMYAEARVENYNKPELEHAWKQYQVRQCKEFELISGALSDIEGSSVKDFEEEIDQIRAEANRMSLADCDALLDNWRPPAGPSFFNALGQVFSWWDVLWMALALGAAYKISGF